MQPAYYIVSEDLSAPAGCVWRVSRGKRVCLVCADRLEAVAFAVSLARDDLAARRVSLVKVRERNGELRVVWSSSNAMESAPTEAARLSDGFE